MKYYYAVTKINKPIQIRKPGDAAPFQVRSKRIYCRRPASEMPDAEFVQYREHWHLVQHDADGAYLATDQRLERSSYPSLSQKGSGIKGLLGD
jgi:hypothetical protein